MLSIFYSTTKRYLIRQSLIKNCANTDSKFFMILNFVSQSYYKTRPSLVL